MWSLAAWHEGTKQVEGTIPSSWINAQRVSWPPVLNAQKHIKECRPLGQKWKTYALIKVKKTSSNYLLMHSVLNSFLINCHGVYISFNFHQ